MPTDRLNQDINPIIRGDNYSIELRVKGDTGDAVDITGRAFYFTAKLSPEQADADAAFSVKVVANGTEAEDGIVYLVVPPSITENLTPTRYWYDVQMVSANDVVLTISRGRVQVISDVTRERSL